MPQLYDETPFPGSETIAGLTLGEGTVYDGPMLNEIRFSAGPIFSISVGPASYVVSVFDGRLITHEYWGSRISADSHRPWEPRVASYMASSAMVLSDTPGTTGQPSPLFSPDLLPREYPSWGTGELRSPAWMVRRADGTRAGALEYTGHVLLHGTQALCDDARPQGLPWVHLEPGRNASTLRIDCVDPAGSTTVSLFYTVMEDVPVLLRWARIGNSGALPITLEAAASASVDLPASEPAADMVTLNGAWARERILHRRPIAPGVQQVESRGGGSGHQHAPFVAVMDATASEHHGRVRGLSLLYSGNHRHMIEMDQFGTSRIQVGINPLGFAWSLEPGSSFDTPACALAFSEDGLNGLTRQFHRFVRTALLPPAWRDRNRPIVANTWEAHYFDVDEAKVRRLAELGAEIGAEMLVLDDGWFTGRNDDSSSLGDWSPDPAKFPDGLRPVAEAVQRAGLKFGIWVEPEMVSPDSDLHRALPEWALQIAGRVPTLARNQLVLDLANPEVVDHLTRVLTDLLESAPIDYVKWDMNRNMSEPGSPTLAAGAQGEVMHRFMLGVYRLLDRLVTRFPYVLFEGCAGGGGRFDFGMLAWTPQFWTSDQTDAIERLAIQRGSSVLFPPETMGAHVSGSPNHQVGRATPAWTRVVTALAFNYGYELDLSRESEQDRAIYRLGSALYRRYRDLLRTGRFVRILPDLSPADCAEARRSTRHRDAAWAVIASDPARALVFHVRALSPAHDTESLLPVPGLDPEALYTVRIVEPPTNAESAPPDADDPLGHLKETVCGSFLMSRGLTVPATSGDFQATLWILEQPTA